MSSDDVAIAVREVSKRYEIYATPRDRLKQFVLPKLHRMVRLGAAGALGVVVSGSGPTVAALARSRQHALARSGCCEELPRTL